MRAPNKSKKQKTGGTRDPWRVDSQSFGYMGSTVDAHDRVERIKKSEDVAWLKRVLDWQPRTTQKTVRLAAERRLRVLLKRQYLGEQRLVTSSPTTCNSQPSTCNQG